LKITLFATYLTSRHSGVAQSIRHIARALDDAGAELQVVAFEVEDGFLPSRARVLLCDEPRLPKGFWRASRLLYPRYYTKALGQLTLPHADGIYTQSMEMALAARRLGLATPIVTHFGHILAAREVAEDQVSPSRWTKLEQFGAERAESLCYRLPNTSHLVSTRIVGRAREEHFRLRDGFFSVSPLGLSASNLPNRPSRAESREHFGIPANATVLICIARLTPWKQIDWVIDAAHSLGPSVHLLILGEGPLKDALRDSIPSEAQDRIRLLGHRTPWEYLAAADIFVLPSRIESFGMVYAEAMWCGLPCIGLRHSPPESISAAQEVISHGLNGFLVENRHELKSRLLELHENPELRAKMGHHSLSSAKANYSAERYASDLLSRLDKP
jgi:glycosyltransferase involved in cell wall biosynthesis